ncbi:DUF1097 domain-containing protein [Arcobacter roscoffensis]|uniref:DUF1097 domain-containing protein n=1 Tax=Arcobacter roscoffensis TaxID=2961520 RepID=A0ABY5E6S8_9BACT|nr:DUF1097 domain-containing protein [Arcobacter roscoffensis]UTJ07847.1 DUF1097 domain-containing protein [Arcobacter roscoffensis]
MKKVYFKVISIFPIAISVGFMTFITAWFCLYMGWTVWLSFLSWALYFLHGGTAQKGLSAFVSFLYGIILAQFAIWYIEFLFSITQQEAWWNDYIIPSSVFIVAAIITLTMRINESWASFIPAVYIGTVFRFAFIDLSLANENINKIVPDLVFPILFGLVIGWCTVTLLVFLDKVGLSQWHRRWEVE